MSDHRCLTCRHFAHDERQNWCVFRSPWGDFTVKREAVHEDDGDECGDWEVSDDQ